MDWLHLSGSAGQVWLVLNELSTGQLAVLIALTAALVAMIVDWRLGLLAQTLQSLCVGLLLSRAILPQLAMLIPLVGALAAFILYWTGRRIAVELERHGSPGNWLGGLSDVSTPISLPFRLLVLLFWALAISTVATQFPLPEVPRVINGAAYWLVGMGLLAIILTREPFKTGLGLLTFSNGFELIYMLFDPSLLVLGLLGIGNILTALVASYLTVARHADLLSAPEALPAPNSPEALLRAIRTLYRFPQQGAEERREREKTAEEPEEVLAP